MEADAQSHFITKTPKICASTCKLAKIKKLILSSSYQLHFETIDVHFALYAFNRNFK